MTSEQMNISLSLTSSPTSPRIPLTISPTSTTPSSLHTLASEASHIPLDKLRIIFRGRLIPKDDSEGNAAKLFMLEEGCVVHCMGKPVEQLEQPSSDMAAVETVAPSVVRPPPPTHAATAVGTVGNGGDGGGGGGGQSLEMALETMKSTHDAKTYATGVGTLIKILDNIISNPNEEKYRRVKRSNPAFQKRLGSLHGSESAMLAIGFTIQNTSTTTTTATTPSSTGEYVLLPSAEAWPKLLQSQTILQTAGREAQRSTPPSTAFPTPTTPFSNTPLPTSLPNLPFPPPGSNPAALTESLLQNPSQFTALLQNPMVRNLMENDPNIANNPMAQQSLRMMQENPQMVEGAMRMMGENPDLRRAFLENAGGLGGLGGGAGGGLGYGSGLGGSTPGSGTGTGGDLDAMRRQMEMMRALTGVMNTTGSSSVPSQPSGTGMTGGSTAPSNTANSNTSSTTGNSGGGGDAEMTEEEMIAEAIARSLRET